MSQDYYHTGIFAKQHTEQLRQQAEHHQHVKEARLAQTANKPVRRIPFLNARGWAANANR